MQRVAVFVDAGYFFAQGSIALTSQRRVRGDALLEIKKLLRSLESFAVDLTQTKLLRIYWYDGTSTGPSPQHIALANEAGVKLRLGFVNAAGLQKGVDSLIVTDMITLARNHAMSDAVLLSGDEDLRVGVLQAQEFGVRVHLLGICSHPDHPQKYSQSQFLVQEADTTHIWTQKKMSEFLSYKAGMLAAAAKPEPAKQQPGADIGTSIEAIAKVYAGEIDSQLIVGLLANFSSSNQIPPDIDRPLLGRLKKELGQLTPEQKVQARKVFIASIECRIPKK